MFFDPQGKSSNLKYNPFKSCIIPRPIGWISTMSRENIVNVAPYSYFNAVSDSPPVVMFSSSLKEDGECKDSIRNIEATGEFVVNIASLRNVNNIINSSVNLPHNHSEASEFDIELAESKLIQVPRVRAAPIALECKFIKKIEIEVEDLKSNCQMLLGNVVNIYIDDKVIKDGKIDVESMQVIARLGYDEYAVIKDVLSIKRRISR